MKIIKIPIANTIEYKMRKNRSKTQHIKNHCLLFNSSWSLSCNRIRSMAIWLLISKSNVLACEMSDDCGLSVGEDEDDVRLKLTISCWLGLLGVSDVSLWDCCWFGGTSWLVSNSSISSSLLECLKLLKKVINSFS